MTASEEEQQISELVARLADKFPHLASGVVGEEVRGIHREFVDHRVREFIPLLVERIAERQLRRRMTYRASQAPRATASILPGMVAAQGNRVAAQGTMVPAQGIRVPAQGIRVQAQDNSARARQ